MNSLRPTSNPGNTNNSSSTIVRRILIDNNTLQEAYQKLLDQVKKVRGMFKGSRASSSNETTADGLNNETSLSSNRTGRINPPWNWPSWGPTSSTTPRSRSAFNRIFYGQFDPLTGEISDRNTYYPGGGGPPAIVPPSTPSMGAGVFGRPSLSDNHYNYVYTYHPKTNTATELEKHTNTTIYIICICLIIMLVGTILFAFVSKCQESSAAAAASSSGNNPSRRRRRRSQNAAMVAHNLANRTEISVITIPDESAPPEYTKVTFDCPPTYDSLFPHGKQ
jgi:hypothetical protein